MSLLKVFLTSLFLGFLVVMCATLTYACHRYAHIMVLKDIIKLRFILFLNLYLRGHGIYIYINICNREYIESNTCVSPYDLGRKGHPPYDVGDAMRRKERREEGRGRKVPEVGTGELGKEAKKSGRIEQEQRKIKERKEGWSKRR